MKWEKIAEKFKNEWVLVDVKKVDENFNLKDGKMLAHSKSKEDIYTKLLEIKPKNFSIEYTGKIPEDLTVVLIHEDI